MTQKEMRKLIKSRLITAPELSNRSIAENLGCSHTTVGNIRKQLEDDGVICHSHTIKSKWINHDYIKKNPTLLAGLNERGLRAIKSAGILDKMQAIGSKSPVYAQRLLNKEKIEANKKDIAKLTMSDVHLFCGDIKNGLSEIANGSIDCIITDPLYHKKALSTIESLKEVAERVLKDNGGILAVMYGTAHLTDFMQIMSNSNVLKYFWTLAVVNPRGSKLLTYRHVMPAWKPIIIYIKGKYIKKQNVYDLIMAPPGNADKKHHIYGQSEGVFTELIERLSNPGDLILDPFLGAGTTGVAAVKLGRKFVGCDIESECVEKSRRRILSIIDSKKESE